MSLAVRLAGIDLEHMLMNAAGTCKTLHQFGRFARSAVSAVVVGPITPEERPVNSGNVYWKGEFCSLNSLGMPNIGEQRFFGFDWLEIQGLAERYDKPVILQIAGFRPEDFRRLAERAQQNGVRHLELNFGCPNIWDDGTQHRIFSFDVGAMVLIANLVREVFTGTVGLKLSPYSDPYLLAEVAGAINDLGDAVNYVACSNTFPNAFVLDPGTRTPVISAGNGLAGMSGKALKPIAMGQVKQFKKLLDHAVIVGVGGITNWRDVMDFQLAGAVACQASTVFWNSNEDPGVYGDIIARQ